MRCPPITARRGIADDSRRNAMMKQYTAVLGRFIALFQVKNRLPPTDHNFLGTFPYVPFSVPFAVFRRVLGATLSDV